MKVNSIQQQNFRGSLTDKLANKIVNNPKAIPFITSLAGCSVVAQKIVMTAGETAVAPVIDIGIGKTITKITNEKDGRTNQSAKTQAARTVAQSIGGTVSGVIIRVACITGATALCMWAGRKAGGGLAGKVADVLTKESEKNTNIKPEELYKYHEKMSAWGKNIGGAMATAVMMFTNFLIDVPFINWINKQISPLFGIKPEKENAAKEVK